MTHPPNPSGSAGVPNFWSVLGGLMHPIAKTVISNITVVSSAVIVFLWFHLYPRMTSLANSTHLAPVFFVIVRLVMKESCESSINAYLSYLHHIFIWYNTIVV